MYAAGARRRMTKYCEVYLKRKVERVKGLEPSTSSLGSSRSSQLSYTRVEF